MVKQKGYSNEFKNAIVNKLLHRVKISVAEVCELEEISKSAAYKWLTCGSILSMKTKSTSKKWSAKEKLKVVSETLRSSESETGLYLRNEGLHSQQLSNWRSQALASLDLTVKQGIKDSRDNRIKELERELLLQDQALAEASALLILQKKIDLIWGNEDPK